MSIELLCLLAFLWCLIMYHHLVYPIILLEILKRHPTPLPRVKEREGPVTDPERSREVTQDNVENLSICILVPAFNEAAVLADKIRNVACLDYPANKLRLIIACDGCSDNSANIARQTALEIENSALTIDVLEFEENRGKVALLNTLIPQIESDIVALSDASALISIDGLKIANRHFDIPSVGVVAATYQLLNPGSKGEQKYWQYQVDVKKGEAAIGSPIGVHGALYFFRRELFTPLPPQIINDDFILPMNIVAQGHKAIYATDLIALELERASLDMDQKRRIRIAAGNLQQLLFLPNLLLPKHGGTAFSFFSGKALRALMPMILVFQLAICLCLAVESTLFLLISSLQILGILSARLSLLIPNFGNNKQTIIKPFILIFYLINGYFSGLIGTLRYLFGLERGCWKSVSKEDIPS